MGFSLHFLLKLFFDSGKRFEREKSRYAFKKYLNITLKCFIVKNCITSFKAIHAEHCKLLNQEYPNNKQIWDLDTDSYASRRDFSPIFIASWTLLLYSHGPYCYSSTDFASIVLFLPDVLRQQILLDPKFFQYKESYLSSRGSDE